ncbi:MAG: two-component system, OmpR family, operon response regulator KdpE [Nocardioidaceae bacterium]|nr:two-component system, OmpR family, operon response regulator KdpE [Nocardioidaceae bacterium]
MTRVLVVDDDPAIQRALGIGLRARGYEVLPARDGRTAVQACEQDEPDVVLLDLGLPDLSGVEVLRKVRARNQVPVIVLSARHGSDDKVEALDVGADDYVTKPFGMDELLARVRAAVRRAVPEEPPAPVVTDAFRVELAAKQVFRDGGELRLTPTEWRLLEALVTRPGRLVTQRQLLMEGWGPGYVAETNYLRVYLAGLRRKLEPDPSRPRYLITEPGMGYRFVP